MKQVMNISLKIIYSIAIGLIVIWLVRPILFWIINLEFAQDASKTDYLFSWFYILPLAVFLTISTSYFDGNRPNSLLRLIIKKLTMSTIAVFLVFISLFLNSCSWIEKEVYYNSKIHSGKIALMEYSCGAYDSDPHPTTEVRIITPLNQTFNWAEECDLQTVDLSIWEKTPNK